jgi:hypothetical protein
MRVDRPWRARQGEPQISSELDAFETSIMHPYCSAPIAGVRVHPILLAGRGVCRQYQVPLMTLTGWDRCEFIKVEQMLQGRADAADVARAEKRD